MMGSYNSRPIPSNGIVGNMPVITNDVTLGWTYLYRVPLKDGHKYRFDGWNVGSFTITGGSCGYFTIELDWQTRMVTIYDDVDDAVVFSADQYADRITIQDNPAAAGGGSVVILTVSGTQASCLAPIPIKAEANQAISLTGNRSFTITGSGAALEHSGSGFVIVNGDLQRLFVEGIGDVDVHGSVKGDVVVPKIGEGTITIDGNVEGQVSRVGESNIKVNGDVKGNIRLNGKGNIRVRGKHHGNIVKLGGNGVVLIENKKDNGAGDA